MGIKIKNQMFKLNNQPPLFTFENQQLSKEQQKLLSKTPEKAFNKLIFRKIKEEDFKVLYSEKGSRPNVAVNVLVSALIYKEWKGMSYNELMESIMFDLRTKAALGLSTIEEKPFSRATLFNFQNRLLEYEQKTGINLLEKVFDNLTAEQLKELKIKTDIQRSDSTLISSNIKNYGRVQLLIEVLLRLWRVLEESDKKALSKLISEYVKTGSEKYVYKLQSKDLPKELSKLGEIYYKVYEQVKGRYLGIKEYENFQRVYQEHFVIVEGSAKAKSNEELSSGILQSPDDPEATYRKKGEKQSKGFSLNVVESANPENPIQLITDISVKKNNIEDSKILLERVDKLKEKIPEIKELHTDAGYVSEAVDKKLEELEIKQVVSSIKGRASEIKIRIKKTDKGIYIVECPLQTKVSHRTKKRYKAKFDIKKCESCELKEKCSIFKNKGKYYFKEKDYLKQQRNNNINNVPQERRSLRANVEATIKSFKEKTRAGKLKVRGLFKASLFAFLRGISINFARIYRFLTEEGGNYGNILTFVNNFINKIIFLIFLTFKITTKKIFDRKIYNYPLILNFKN